MDNSIIKCPYCGTEHAWVDFVDVSDMEGEFEVECIYCEKQFTVKFKTEIRFEVIK